MTDTKQEHAELKQKFDLHYQTELVPILKKHEKTRYKYLAAFCVLLFLSLVFYPLIIKYILVDDGAIDVGKIISASGVLIMIFGAPLWQYKSKIKPDIIPLFTKFFGDFSYDFGRSIHEEILRQSRLFKTFDYAVGDDFFSGNYDGVQITLSEEKHYKMYQSTRGTQRQKTFSGICIVLQMNKKFQGQTIGLTDRGILNSFYKIKDMQNVKLEDIKFEKIFEVFSDDQIEARYLLTTAFMERLLKLRDLFGAKNIQFSFFDNKLLLAIPTKQDMFEAQSFFHTNLNKKKIDIVFEQFYTVFTLIKILKLNQNTGL